MKSLRDWHDRSIQIEEGLRALHLLAVNMRLFREGHPELQNSLNAAEQLWGGLLSELGEVELKQIRVELIYQNMALQGHLKTTEEFAQGMKRRGIECMVFRRGLNAQDLKGFAQLWKLSDVKLKEVGDLNRFLQDQGVWKIEIWTLGDLQQGRHSELEKTVGLPIALKDLSAFRRDTVCLIDDINHNVRTAHVLDLDTANQIVGEFINEATATSGIMLGLSAIRSADEYTSTHSLNVCILSICFARYLGITGDHLFNLGIACLTHDIGKMFIPEEILNKPGKLSPEEWNLMEHHTTYGARFLLSVPGLSAMAPLVAYEHHMGVRGTGYPRPRRPYRVNLVSLIASLADYYDALTTSRPYKRALTPTQGVEIMKKIEEDKVEPRLRRLFLSMLGRYPAGSVVRLDTGELGVVSLQNEKDSFRPEVYILTDPEEKRLDKYFPVNLTEVGPKGTYQRSIMETVDPMQMEIDPLAVLQSVLDQNFAEKSLS